MCKMKTANIYNYISCTISEGPGKRFAIWFQGCLQRCKGCCNQRLLSMDIKNYVYIEEILKEIKKSKEENDIEGITFLGGEPILQIHALIDIAKFCKKENLTTILFSGYTKAIIEKIFPKESKILFENLDILIDGPFKIELIDNERKWIGSKNQKIYFFSNRYNLETFKNEYIKSIEFRTEKDELIINGWPFK